MKFSSTSVQKYLASQELGRLALSTLKGKPHLTAVGFVFDTKKVYMYVEKKSKKVMLVKRNPHASFIADDGGGEAGWRYVMVEGTAYIVKDSAEFGYASNLICDKYPQIVGTDWMVDQMIHDIIVIEPEKVLAANI